MSAITASQTKQFWVAFSRACTNLGITTKEDREKYRKEVLKTDGGVLHLRDLNRTTGYDKVMARLSMDSGDYSSAVKYAESTAFRLIKIIEYKAQTLVGSNWQAYLRGVQIQAHIGSTRPDLCDLTDSELRALIAILDTRLRHVQRA